MSFLSSVGHREVELPTHPRGAADRKKKRVSRGAGPSWVVCVEKHNRAYLPSGQKKRKDRCRPIRKSGGEEGISHAPKTKNANHASLQGNSGFGARSRESRKGRGGITKHATRI